MSDILQVEFSLGDESPRNYVPAGFIRRMAPVLFRSGEYKDKNFSLTPDELKAAVADFKAVAIGLEHKPTVLDGKLGTFDVVKASADNKELAGEALLPEWLDKALDADGRKLSVAFNRATKRIVGVDLVRTPRISDAALLASFSSSETGTTKPMHFTPHGRANLQSMHDLAAQSGAMCSTPGKGGENPKKAEYAAFNAEHELEAFQHAHDVAVEHGAQCKVVQPAGPNAEMSAEMAQLKEQLALARKEGIEAKAVTFADKAVLAKKYYPAEKSALIARYAQAAKDDLDHPGVVTFADGNTVGSRIAALEAEVLAKPTHLLTEELLDPKQTEALFNKQVSAPPPGQMAPERMAALMKATPLGQAVLDHARNGK